MFKSGQLEDLIRLVSSLDRDALIEQFHSYQSNFPLDFTPEFLEQTPIERLRHIFLALCLQCRRLPDQQMIHAA